MKPPQKLLNRNFTLLWSGETTSLLGYQAFIIAMNLLILNATNSATLMGLMDLFATLPGVLLGPIGGAIADRYPRRRIIILGNVVRGLAVVALSLLAFAKPGETAVIMAFLGITLAISSIVGAFYNPAIQAAIPDIVPTEKIASANSLNYLSISIAGFLGTGLGGGLYNFLGGPLLFLINGIGYLVSAVTAAFARIPQPIRPSSSGDWRVQLDTFKTDLADGFRYVWRRTGLRETVLASSVLAFFTAPVMILIPFYVKLVLNIPEPQVGIWYSALSIALGLGGVCGYAVISIVRLTGRTRGRWMIVCILLESIGFGVLGFVSNQLLAVGLAFLGGATGAYVGVNMITILQITTPAEMRGRVLGLMGTISASLAPVASGLAGIVADALQHNIPLIYACCGGMMTLISIAVVLSPRFRALVQTDGKEIIPDIRQEPAVSGSNS
jgi:MFS transporter, DHA3 family, macrolide efflux protein